jgi:hypothetical protein
MFSTLLATHVCDFTEFGLGRYEAAHESILYYQANVQQTFIQITENDYKLCPDFGSIFKKMSEPKPFTLDSRLQKNLQAQVDQQAGSRANKQQLQNGKLIVIDMQANQAIKSGKYTLRDALLYHTNHTSEELVCVPDDSLKHRMPALRNKLMTEVHKGLTAMHLGSNRSEYEIRRHAYWPRIRNDIHAFLDLRPDLDTSGYFAFAYMIDMLGENEYANWAETDDTQNYTDRNTVCQIHQTTLLNYCSVRSATSNPAYG